MDLMCNPDSNETNCMDFFNQHGSTYDNMKYRALYSIGTPQGNANIRDNDACVRKMITFEYWGAAGSYKFAGFALFGFFANFLF